MLNIKIRIEKVWRESTERKNVNKKRDQILFSMNLRVECNNVSKGSILINCNTFNTFYAHLNCYQCGFIEYFFSYKSLDVSLLIIEK